MAKGNKNAYMNFPIANNTEMDNDENAVLCQYALDIFNSKEPDLHKPEEVEQAINNYFKNCIDKGLRPGNLGLYASLGIDKKQAYDLIHGLTPKKANPRSIEHLKKAIKAMGTYREMLGAQGKLSPPVLIFWQKNFDGLEDVQRMEVTAQTQENAELSPDEIANKIESDIPVDVPYKETE